MQTLEARQAAEQIAQPQKIVALKAEQNELLARRKALAAQEMCISDREMGMQINLTRQEVFDEMHTI